MSPYPSTALNHPRLCHGTGRGWTGPFWAALVKIKVGRGVKVFGLLKERVPQISPDSFFIPGRKQVSPYSLMKKWGSLAPEQASQSCFESYCNDFSLKKISEETQKLGVES